MRNASIETVSVDTRTYVSYSSFTVYLRIRARCPYRHPLPIIVVTLVLLRSSIPSPPPPPSIGHHRRHRYPRPSTPSSPRCGSSPASASSRPLVTTEMPRVLWAGPGHCWRSPAFLPARRGGGGGKAPRSRLPRQRRRNRGRRGASRGAMSVPAAAVVAAAAAAVAVVGVVWATLRGGRGRSLGLQCRRRLCSATRGRTSEGRRGCAGERFEGD